MQHTAIKQDDSYQEFADDLKHFAFIPLNEYQQLLLRLSGLSPYNAVHIVLMDNPLGLHSDFEHSINETIKTLGLGLPQFSSNKKYVRYDPLYEPIRLQTTRLKLMDHIEREMNHSFANDIFPLRFFINTTNDMVFFAITYNHWVADAFSISLLVENIFKWVIQQQGSSISLPQLAMEDHFKHIYRRRLIYYRYAHLAKTILRFSQAFRIPIHNESHFESGSLLHVFEKQHLDHFLHVAKRAGITLNDLFVTILAQLFGELTETQRQHVKVKRLKPKRDKIVIGVISNVRNEGKPQLNQTFGLFLGFFYIAFKNPNRMSFNTLSQFVHKKTKKYKTKHYAIKQYLLFKIQNKMWDRRKNSLSKSRLFSKNTPITAGISNMDLSRMNASLSTDLKYIRFSPTAMVCPIVFNLTTLNGWISLGINFRKTCYTDEEAQFIKDDFVRRLFYFTSTNPKD